MIPFADRLAEAAARTAPVVVGLDPRLERLPSPLTRGLAGLEGAAWREAAAAAVQAWSEAVVGAVAGVVPAVKPQSAFYEQLGAPGFAALEATCRAAREAGLLVILDAKRGDIGSTAEAYARATLDPGGPLEADAVTLSPYLGRDSVAPFLERCDRYGRGLFVLARTSNPGGGDLQRLGEPPVSMAVAGWVRRWNEDRLGKHGYGPVGAVVGATVPEEAGALRAAMPGAWLLVPGYGAQGGGAADTLPCFHEGGRGALVNSSRGVTFAGPGEEREYDLNPGAVIRRRAAALAADIGGMFLD